MLKCKTKCGSFLVCSSVIILYLMQQVICSEFPDRECCDEKLPRIIESETISSQSPLSTTTTLTTQTPISASTLKPGSNIRTAIAILNCILARQLCFEDPSCSAILEIIPRVCGPIPVACSTVTVTKCQAALRTLQAFPFFRPTCLCKEPGVDPDCNSFRDFLFDHPCGFVLKKEKDPYPIDALPTCNHALSVCQQERKCIILFEEFKSHCKVRDNKCRMEDRELCHESWTNLRLSPMFGCICPNNHMKRRCDRIFSIVNHNPCIVRSMGMDESYYQSVFDDNIALIETPLTAPPSIHYSNHHNAPSYPYNLSAFQGGNSAMDNLLVDNASSKQHSMDVPRDGTLDIIKLHFQSNCHTALITCREDAACNTALQPVLSQCELHRCNRNACMSALQSFYQGSHEDISLDIAFCFCKKTNDRHDACMSAQEKLHPTCAQRPSEIKSSSDSNGVFYLPPPACNVVANMCKENADCRKKLEYYEQACAIDSVTKKCAGKSSICRQAVLGILGTSLRIACVCQTGDLQNMYECLAWQRLLWSNACVVDSQKDFYTKRLAELGLLATRPPPVITEVTVASGPVTSNWLPQDPNTIYQPAHSHMTDPVVTEMPIEIDYMGSNGKAVLNASNDLNSVLQNGDQNTSTGKENGFTRDKIQELIEDTDMQYPPTTTEATESLIATMSTTMTTVITTTMTTTTQAPKNCVVQRPYQQDQLIQEGSSRRIYSLDDVECSELCICGESLILTCHALCVPFAPCRTALAFYNHASPAYQAFRGRCLCYSGQFICMRPPPGEYYLPGGVFLLLGYSATDEALLRPHTNLGVRDAVRALQEYVTTYIDNKTQCVLTLFNMTDQNIIISARLPNDPQLNAYELLQKEKEECSSVLESLSQLINTEYSELQAHRLLSIFKMAEVQVVWYETNNSIRSALHFCNIEIYSMLVISVIPYSTWLITNINFKLT